VELDPGLRPALLALVEPDERGDPMSPLRWTVKSTRNLAAELTRQGHRVSADTVGDLLRQEGFSLQAGSKTIEGKQHPDRDAQFRYINEQARQHMGAGQPVISVDTKKKELVGDYKNAGRQWRPEGEPVLVKTHDFLDRQGPGKAIPYGIYDIAANTGWVSVGTDHDTAAFAVASIRRWWQARGRHDYPAAARLLITADAGGSNGYRTRAWKTELAALATETGLDITVCHMPPGTSKWNKIEHRLFSHISMNWRGRGPISTATRNRPARPSAPGRRVPPGRAPRTTGSIRSPPSSLLNRVCDWGPLPSTRWPSGCAWRIARIRPDAEGYRGGGSSSDRPHGGVHGTARAAPEGMAELAALRRPADPAPIDRGGGRRPAVPAVRRAPLVGGARGQPAERECRRRTAGGAGQPRHRP
jgi:hypothetical protein